MWNRKELKNNGKEALKVNYGRTIAVCFIVVCFIAAFTTSTRLITRFSHESKLSKNIVEVMGVQSTAYAVGNLCNDILKGSSNDVKEVIDVTTVERIADVTLDPNSATVNLVKIIDNFIVNGLSSAIIFLIVGFIIKLLYNVFIGGALQIGGNRFFLENRVYKNTPIHRIFYLFWLKKIFHPSIVLLVIWIKERLWWLTIAGGIYKRYEYKMIPFIMAENPYTTTKQAFLISRKMMKGHKWNTFKLEISFLGWDICNIFTAGILNIFFINAYKKGTYAELYMSIRNQAIEDGTDYSIYFIDTNLEPSKDFLEKNDYIYFYDNHIVRRNEFENLNPSRSYTISSLIMFFFIFSFAGWCFEVGMHLVGDGIFVNRGTMHGPWLPIFGSGGMFVILFMRRTINKPIFTFFTIAGVCTALEYVVSLYLEIKTGIRWWDYSEYFMNYEGRICLYGALVFGFGGCGFLYYIAPLLDNQLKRIPQWLKFFICVSLIILFINDIYISLQHPNTGAGITDYKLD